MLFNQLNIAKVFIPSVFLFFITGCANRSSQPHSGSNAGITEIKYAKGFSISDYKDYREIRIHNPWQKATNVELKYRLYHLTCSENRNENNIHIIKTPVRRVICLSTTHIAFIDKLGFDSCIVGISGKQYVNNRIIKKGIAGNKIKDVGYDQNINYESIISLKPDLVMAYSIESENTSYINKIQDLGIPVIFIAEYLEQHPLGKAEWLKCIAALFEADSAAIQMFNEIEKEYILVERKCSEISAKPYVMTGLLWNSSWFVPNGKSYLAELIHDAGAEYIWKEKNGLDVYPLSLEVVLNNCKKADYWINPGIATSKEEILKINSHLSILRPFKENKIFNNNAILNESGGNDYWESGVVNPQLILKDLVSIFHPEIFSDHKLYYYKKIE